MPHVLTVNAGAAEPDPGKPGRVTGIGKRPIEGRADVRPPGPKRGGLGSGLVGDAVCDHRHHGGDDQALYAFAREDLDRWEQRLGRELPNGMFGENLTTAGIALDEAVVGEVWRIGPDVRVQVTDPRIPCGTFQRRMGVAGWLAAFTAEGRPGTYLRILAPGTVGAGDEIVVEHRPAHGVTVAELFRALTTERDRLAAVARVGDDLTDGVRAAVDAAQAARR